MKGRVFVRHMDDIKVIHRRRYLRLEGISVEFTNEWEDAASSLHKAYGDGMWRETLERIIRLGLKEYVKEENKQ